MTPEEQAAASATWLQQNRPDLVNTQNTAEQAAALNLQWRAINAPGTITPSELQQANIYRQQFVQQQQDLFNQQQVQRQQFGGYADQDAYNEAQKHYQAFHASENIDVSQLGGMTLSQIASRYGDDVAERTQTYFRHNPSAAAQEITSAYEYQHNRVVGENGVMYQGAPTVRNPFPEDSALGIAWLVAKTGGASDANLNLIAEAEGKAAGVDTSWIRYATDIFVERPYFAREVLTTQTGQVFVNKEWNGVPIRLNLTREEMAAGLPSDQFKNVYRYSDASRRLEAVTSPEINIDYGVHKAPMDYGGPLLQGGSYGGWTREGGVSERLVGGKTVAGDFQYEQGGLPKPFLSGSSAAQTPTTTLRPSDFDLFVMGANIPFAKEIVQVADFWLGGRSMETTTKGPVKYGTPSITEGQAVTEYSEPITTKEAIPGGWLFTTTAAATTTTSKTINTPITQDITTTAVPVKSGFDSLLGGFEDKIRSLIPAPEVGEYAVKLASLGNVFIGPQMVGGEIAKRGAEFVFGPDSDLAKSAKESAETAYQINPAGLSGQYTTFYEHPTMTGINYVIGAGFGGLAAGAEKIYMGGRAIMAEKAIASGGAYRLAEQGSGAIMKWAPVVLGGVYAADIAGRSTKGFTDFAPERVIPSAKGLVMQEAVPMAAGFNALPNLAKKVALSDLAYKSELQLGETTGRFDYYVKQPIRESVRPIQNDFLSFRESFQADQPKAFIKQDVGIADYIAYRANRAYQLNIAQPIDAFAQEAPGKAAAVYERAYGAYFDAKVRGILPTGGPRYQEPVRAFELSMTSMEQPMYPGSSTKPRTFSDIKATAINRYNTFMADIVYPSKVPVAPEIVRPTVAPENEYAFQYTRITASEKFDAFIDFLYSPKLSRVITPSTFGETKFIPFPTTTGTTGSSGVTGTRTTRPGEPGAPKFRKTVIGGVERVGLAKEPSLASMGIKDVAKTGRIDKAGKLVGGEPVRTDWRSTDYRGKPASATMKPLWESKGKQATGIGLLTEELPVTEGMTTGIHMPNVNVWAVVPIPRTRQEPVTELVYVLTPETTFMQESETEQQRSVMSITAQSQMPRQVQVQEPRFMQDVLQELQQSQRERQFVAEASRVSSVTPLRSPIRDTSIDVRTIYDIEQEERQIVSPITITDYDMSIDQKIRQEQKTDTRQDIIEIPWQGGWQYTEEVPWKVGGPLPWGGGGGGGGGKNSWRKAALEVLYIGPRAIRGPAVRMPKQKSKPRKKK